MKCPNCNKGELEIQEVLVSRTTDPKDDDLWEKMYYCPNCEVKLPICSEEEEE